MLASAPLVGFLPVTDSDVATRFYSGQLGLRIQSRDSFALALAAGSGTIRCARIPCFEPQPFTILGWEVPNLEAAAEALRHAGVPVLLIPELEQDARGIWTAPDGSAVLWFKDPFGNTLSLSRQGEARAR